MTYAAEVLADSPIAWWRLGEASGAVMGDSSGNSHTGSYTASPTLGVAGLLSGDSDTAVTFNGSTQWGQSDVSTAYNVVGAITLEAWFNTATASAAASILDRDAGGAGSRQFQLRVASGKPQAILFAGTTPTTVAGPSNVNDSKRHYVAATWDGTTIRVYIDGVLVNSGAFAGPFATGSVLPLFIGAHQESSARQAFAGTIDEVAIYATALSPTRIAAHYAAGVVTGAVSMSATSGLTVAGTTAYNAVAALSGSSGMAIGGVVKRTKAVTATRARTAVASDSARLPIDVASGAGWEDVARGRTAIATVEVQDPDAAEPPDHHRINHAWLDITLVTLDDPDRMPIDWAYTSHSVDWGRYQIRVGGKDVTWFRGNHTIITELSDTEPGGDDTCTIVFPGIGPYESLGTGDLYWLPRNVGDEHIPIKILRVLPNGTKIVQFEGDAFAEEDIQDGQGSGLTLHCTGVIKTLDDRITKPRFTSDPLDIAVLVHRFIQNEVRYGWPGHAPPIDLTGILTAERGQYGSPLWSDTIQNLLATAQLGENTRYALTNNRPRGMQWVVKDVDTIHVSAYCGQQGVTHSLVNDDSRRFDAIYGEGQAGGLRYWRNTQYPNAHAAGDIPAYPVDPSITFDVGDSNSDLHLFFDELQSRNYHVISNNTYLAADVDDVERFQTDAGITVDGVIGPQTWTRAFQDSLNRHILDAYVRPLAVRQTAEPYLYNSHGGIIGDNPVYNHRMRREVLEQFGTLERSQARQSARTEIQTIVGTNYTGTITFTNIDPPEMCALDIRAGMNISFRHHRGPGNRLLHIARVDRDPGMVAGGSRTVTLTVSERPDDYITIAERIARRRGVIDQSGRTKPPRRSSARTPDFAPWDEESGAGRLLPIAQFAGLWNVIPIPAGERGEIVHMRLVADRPTLISAAVFNWHVSPDQLTNLPGLANPHVGIGGSAPPDPWQANSKILTDRPEYADQSWLAFASGSLDSMQGYYPHDPSTDSSTITGVLDDADTWPYHSRRAPWLWLAIWTSVSCVIGGDPAYKHRVLWNAGDTG